jgi:hypothetical protein
MPRVVAKHLTDTAWVEMVRSRPARIIETTAEGSRALQEQRMHSNLTPRAKGISRNGCWASQGLAQ